MSRINPLSIEKAAAEWDRRDAERRKGESMGDGDVKSLWYTVSHSSIFAPVLVAIILAAGAAAAGVLALPAAVQNHSARIEKVEGKVDVLERADIARDKDMEFIGKQLDAINKKLDKLDEQRDRRR